MWLEKTVRKLWCAGAIACGILLLGAGPARADELPTPSGLDTPVTALGYALAPTNDWRLFGPVASDPLGGGPLVTLKAGDRQLLKVKPGGQRQDQPTEKPADHRRVLPAADLVEKGMKFARELAAGPTLAHGATKRLVRSYLDGGVAAADATVPEIAGPLFDSEDLENAVESFLADGPGKATFEGK